MENIIVEKENPDSMRPLRCHVSNGLHEPGTKDVVMTDECGDTMWDKVLMQDNKFPPVVNTLKNK